MTCAMTHDRMTHYIHCFERASAKSRVCPYHCHPQVLFIDLYILQSRRALVVPVDTCCQKCMYIYIYIRFKFVHQYLHPALIASSIFNSYLYAVLYCSVIVCSSLARPYHVDTPRGSFSDGGLVTQNPLYCMINSIKREKHNKSNTMQHKIP